MNIVNALTKWMIGLSEEDPHKISSCKSDIQGTCENLMKVPLPEDIKKFFNVILMLTSKDIQEVPAKLKLLESISVLQDYFFINSFDSIAHQFEEFLRMSLKTGTAVNKEMPMAQETKINENTKNICENMVNSTDEESIENREFLCDNSNNLSMSLLVHTSPMGKILSNQEKQYKFSANESWPIRVGSEISGLPIHIKMNCSSQCVFENYKSRVFVHETATNQPNAKIQVKRSLIETGQLYTFGDTNLKIKEAKPDGTLSLQFIWANGNKKQNYEVTGENVDQMKIGRNRDNRFRFREDFKMSKNHAVLERDCKR